MLTLPPALFPHLRGAHDRMEAAARYYAMVETEHFGVTSTWIGQGEEPKPSYRYDSSERERHLQALGEQAGILAPAPTTQEAKLAADRAAWQLLRQKRRMRA